MLGNICIFCPTSGDGHRSNYYKNFYSNNLKWWFSNQLHRNFNAPPLIIMENGNHHEAQKRETPITHKMRKAQTLQKLRNRGVHFDENSPRAQLIVLLRN